MKDWSNDIAQHINTWQARLGSLGWWPRFVYHFTDVQNAVKVLEQEYLYSRVEATKLGLMQVDNASSEIIAQTSPEIQNNVRLYFRPRTPTQYRNEGIRPKNQRPLGGAHCPVPIFFCFDAFTVLSLDSTKFSNGNMSSRDASCSSERGFFFQIPFQYVFHDGAYSQAQAEIKFHRNAEVLVPNNLPLRPALKFIACRSVAERQTLLHLLPAPTRKKWERLIRLGEQGLFQREWTFIERVLVVDEQVFFYFNPNTKTPGPFEIKFEYIEASSGRLRTRRGSSSKLNGKEPGMVTLKGASAGAARLYLDDALAFAGNLIFDDIPF